LAKCGSPSPAPLGAATLARKAGGEIEYRELISKRLLELPIIYKAFSFYMDLKLYI
jgi:hypothetical protein